MAPCVSFENFVLCLRAIRLWAKRRGIYSNKMGYLGGINCNILTAYICQLYPRSTASVLLYRFFQVYANWRWPQPVTLCQPYQVRHDHVVGLSVEGRQLELVITHRGACVYVCVRVCVLGGCQIPDLGLKVWDPNTDRRQYQELMPILTPSYPSGNSSFNVNRSTLRVMTGEFQRGLAVVRVRRRTLGCCAGWSRNYVTSSAMDVWMIHVWCWWTVVRWQCEKVMTSPPEQQDWNELFNPSEFFVQFGHYLALDFYSPSKEVHDAWVGFAESKIRKLVEALEIEQQLVDIFLFPKAFKSEVQVSARWHWACSGGFTRCVAVLCSSVRLAIVVWRCVGGV